MNIYTFYEPITSSSNQHRSECDAVLDLWKYSWKQMGWTPIVLNLEHAKLHSKYDAVIEKLKSMPNAHYEPYNTLCFVRWLAIAHVGGWYADHDMINYNFAGVWDNELSITLCAGNTCPSVLHMTSENYNRNIIQPILDYEHKDGDSYSRLDDNGQPCVSDMDLLSNARTVKACDLVMHLMGEYGRNSWSEIKQRDEHHASIVHYAGPYILPDGTTKAQQIHSIKRGVFA